MKNKRTLSLLCAAALVGSGAVAQVVVDYDKYPDYTPPTTPDTRTVELLKPKAEAATARPDHVNNAETIYFPPVFNQDGGSCGSASRIGYMFNYEMNAYRGLDGSLEENQYPTHFTWLLTNSGSSKEGMAKANGVPTVPVYGGRTYSALFGNQDTASPDFGWMQGYDKWYSAMFNRIEQSANFPYTVGTEEGREMVKNWLWNHNGDTDFHAGGICGIGVASGGTWLRIPQTEANDAAGVTGKYYVGAWGAQVDHALTIVGYDDRIEFDLDGNGVYGETDKDEVGAWIVVNSWGDGWCNGGFIYCPYKNAVTAGNNGDYYKPEIYMVRKDYRPLRTFKITMDYSKRSELRIGGGISADLTADEPEKTTYFEHFKFAGDGDGDGVDAETPMLGRWADGMHSEPMEFGYDMTDLSAAFDTRRPLKYFLVIESKSGATGTGTVSGLSVLDYEFDTEGIEFPADLGAEGVSIKNAGNRTIISVVVPGEAFNAPRNLTREAYTLRWTAPAASQYTPTGYRLYCDGELMSELAASELAQTVADTFATYQVSALYDFQGSVIESARSAATVVPFRGSYPETNYARRFTNSGFLVEDVFTEQHDQATIEYWLRPVTLTNWNQQMGPAWGQFMIHTTSSGEVVAGWDTSNRITTAAGSLKVNTWTHVAIVVDGGDLTVYLDGEVAGTLATSCTGIGAIGDFNVGTTQGANGSLNAYIDELRIWSTARTQREIQQYMYAEIADPATMPGLMVDVPMSEETSATIVDVAGGHTISYYGTQARATYNTLLVDKRELAADFNLPADGFTVGMPAEVENASSPNAVRWTWTATGSDVDGLEALSPAITFAQAGTQTITLTAFDANGNSHSATKQVEVAAAQAPTASFNVHPDKVAAGERVSFINTSTNTTGCSYSWSMPGADVETSTMTNAGASYAEPGQYEVTLTVTGPQGTSTAKHTVTVVTAAPEAAFSLSPAVILKGETAHFTDESKFQPTSWTWQVQNNSGVVLSRAQDFQATFDRPGMYSVALEARNAVGANSLVRPRALIVCNADGQNGLNFNGGSEQVTFDNPIPSKPTTFTIDWWMYGKAYGESINGIGADASSLLITTGADGSMSVSVGGGTVISTGSHFVTLSEWHHYAVSYRYGYVYIYKDGVLVASGRHGAYTGVVMPEQLSIGLPSAPMNAVIDEFRVWMSYMDAAKVKSLCNQPIDDVAAAESTNKLAVYYQFNQSSGDVIDATSNAATGTRTGFGPEGDAWSSSLGIFCLDFESGEDVTALYLTNYAAPFTSGSGTVNTSNSSRFRTLLQDTEESNWTLLNTVVNGSVTTGFHVDGNKDNALTVTTGWDGFASSLSDHAAYQNVLLPAGFYSLTVKEESEFASNGSYLVAALGDGLPSTTELAAQALAYADLGDKALSFVVDGEQEVSMGMLINMSGSSCLTVKELNLMRLNFTEVDATGTPTAIDQAPTTTPDGPSVEVRDGRAVITTDGPQRVRVYSVAGQAVFDRIVSGTVTLQLPAGVYIVGGQKVLVR